MENIELKNMTLEEFRVKKIVLEASGFFDEGAIKMLEVAIQRKMPVMLSAEQTKFLETMNLVAEKEMDLGEKKTIVSDEITPESDKNIKTAYEEQGKEISQSVEDEEVIVQNDSMVQGAVIEDAAQDVKELDATVEVETEKNDEEQKFLPDSPEDIQNMPPEVIEKMYYLTGERMIETLKRMNNGNTWKVLGMSGKDNELQVAIEKAYKSVIYPSDLADLDFLDKRVGEYLSDDNQALQLKDLHRAALMGTYVGYHVEQNEQSVDEFEEEKNVAIIKFPLLADDLPDSLKDQTKTDLKKAINRSIEDIFNTPDSYKALLLILPIEERIDESIQRYSEGLHENEENKAVRAYIKTIRANMDEEVKNGMSDLNVSLDLYGIDWEDKETRKSVIAMIHTLQGDGRETEVENLVEEINMSFDVNSPADIGAVDKACEDLSKLSNQGIKVNIAFDIPPKEVMNPELQEALNDVVDKYDNIERDTSEELVSNGVDLLISEAIEQSVATEMISAVPGMSLMNDLEKGAIMGLSLGATAFAEIGREMEEFLERNRNPNEGGGQ